MQVDCKTIMDQAVTQSTEHEVRCRVDMRLATHILNRGQGRGLTPEDSWTEFTTIDGHRQSRVRIRCSTAQGMVVGRSAEMTYKSVTAIECLTGMAASYTSTETRLGLRYSEAMTMLSKVNDPHDVSSRARYRLDECPDYVIKLTVSMTTVGVASADIECEYKAGTNLHDILYRMRLVCGHHLCEWPTKIVSDSEWYQVL